MYRWDHGSIFGRVQRMGFGAIPPSFLPSPPLALSDFNVFYYIIIAPNLNLKSQQKTRRDKESPTCNSGGAPPSCMYRHISTHHSSDLYVYNHNLLDLPTTKTPLLHFNFQRCTSNGFNSTLFLSLLSLSPPIPHFR